MYRFGQLVLLSRACIRLVEYLPSGLSRLGQFQPSAAKVQGFDISHWQTNIDFQAAYTSGARFVIIKASDLPSTYIRGYAYQGTASQATEGRTVVDAKFQDYTDKATNAGFVHGAYHFARPSSSTGQEQAEFFLTHGGAWVDDGMTLPGMVDLENNPSGSQCYGLSEDEMVNWIIDFVDTYSGTTGRFPMIYTTNNWWVTCTADYDGFSTHCPLVLARYAPSPGLLPGGWSSYTVWQNSDAYPYGGDSDIFNGDESDLLALASG